MKSELLMRICLISREYPPETGFGGIATFVHHLAHGLKEIGHDVEVVALAKETEKVVDDNGVKVHRVLPYRIESNLDAVNRCLPYSRYVLLTTLGLWRKFLEIHEARPFDVAESPELLSDSLYASVLRVVPLVIRLYTPHSKFMAEKLHNAGATFDHMFLAMLERIAMAGADVLTSPSRDLAEYIAQDLPYPLEDIAIVRNPIDPQQFSPDGPHALSADGRQTVLYVGRLEERKGVHHLIEAIPSVLKECPQTRFVIIGDDTNYAAGGQRSVLADLKERLKQSSCLQAVTFIPRIPLSALPDYYRSADIVAVPSLYDNSPYTCLEAMSCGRPVIGTSAGGTREYVEHEVSGLIVAPRNPEEIAAAAIKMLKDPDYRQRLGENARKQVLEKFQRKKIAADTVELYRLAAKRFENNRRSLYLRPADQAAPDAAVMLYSLNSMIYSLMYQESHLFRLSHRWHHLLHRPRLFAAKAMLYLVRPLSRFVYGRTDRTLSLQRWLESQVTARQEDPLVNVIAAARKKELTPK